MTREQRLAQAVIMFFEDNRFPPEVCKKQGRALLQMALKIRDAKK